VSRVVVDANVLIGFRLRRDQFFEPATSIVRGIDDGELPDAIVTDFILAEVLNIVGERAGAEHGVKTLDALLESSGFEVTNTSRGDFVTGQALYREYDRLSFVDAITVAFMRRTGTEYVYSFDDDFDGVDGIKRLDTPNSPYGGST